MLSMKNKLSLIEHLFTGNKLTYLLSIIVAVTPVVLALIYAPIDPDSGYYLAIIERINDGYIPYKDFPTNYTPLVFYIGLIYKNIFSIGINYEAFLFLHFVIQFLSAYFVYKLTFLFTNINNYGFFAAILFIISSHWNGGNVFLLETPSLLFGLWSIYYIIRYPQNLIFIFISGFLTALSFLCKQYGLGFIFLTAYILIHFPKKIKLLITLFLGFSIPILISFTIFGSEFLAVLYGNGYSSGLEFTDRIIMFFKRFIFLHLFSPVLLFVWLNSFWLLKNNNLNSTQISMLILGLLGFMLQFFFQPFSHYFLYVIPFVCIIIFTVYKLTNKFRLVYKLFIILTFFLSIIATYHFRVNKFYIQNANAKTNQKEIADILIKHISNKQTLYVGNVNLIEQYYLTNLLPPNFKTIGYTFGAGLSPHLHKIQMEKADFILRFNSKYLKKEYNTYTDEKYNQLNNRKQISINDRVSLYK